jgi:hypothetical protein
VGKPSSNNNTLLALSVCVCQRYVLLQQPFRVFGITTRNIRAGHWKIDSWGKKKRNKFDRLCQQHNRAAKKQGAEKIKNYFWTQHTQNTLDMHAIIVLDDQVTKMQFQKNKFLFFKKEREMILLFFY